MKIFQLEPMSGERVGPALVLAALFPALGVGVVCFGVLATGDVPLAPAVVWGLVAFVMAAIYAFATAGTIGLGLYLVALRRLPARWWICVASGALVAMAGAVAVAGFAGLTGSIGMQDRPWAFLALAAAVVALPGAFGGLIFWVFAAWQPKGFRLT